MTERTSASYELIKQYEAEKCIPSEESVAGLQQADVVLVTGEFVGAGKSTFITDFERHGRHNIASWTNRDLRPDEKEGVDKCHHSLEEMAAQAKSGAFLELAEVREGMFYATPAEFTPSKKYVKDLGLGGAIRLRSFAPDLPLVLPLPPVDSVDSSGLTEWERRLMSRQDYKRIDDQVIKDMRDRLEGVVKETDRIFEYDLFNDPNALIIVNDDLHLALGAVFTFLQTGEKLQQGNVRSTLQRISTLASAALDATA